jgi:hypothetical protein
MRSASSSAAGEPGTGSGPGAGKNGQASGETNEFLDIEGFGAPASIDAGRRQSGWDIPG